MPHGDSHRLETTVLRARAGDERLTLDAPPANQTSPATPPVTPAAAEPLGPITFIVLGVIASFVFPPAGAVLLAFGVLPVVIALTWTLLRGLAERAWAAVCAWGR